MFKLYNYTDTIDFSDYELTPKEAILAKCYDCCCYQGVEVKACTSKNCPLFKFKEKWFKLPRKRNENDKRSFNTFGKSKTGLTN